ncbi:MAG: metal ABC transporter solute-binding protein, Zn/Mn family [Muribaculaceae bacterium]
MKKYFPIIFLTAILCSCGNKNTNDGQLKVAVSIPPEVFVVNAIAADSIDLYCIMEKGNNPESFEPSISQIRELTNSDVYFSIGLLDFERGLTDRISESGKNVTLINLCDSVDLLYGTHGDCPHHHHHKSDADPHIWSSIENLRKMGTAVCNTLSRLDSKNAGFYRRNLADFIAKLDSADNIIKQSIDIAPSKSFIVWHPSLSYFAHDYGLTQIVVGNHGKEQSISQLKDRIDEAVSQDCRVFLFQKEFDSSQATTANEKIGARFVEINSMNENVTSELIHISNELSK